MAEGAAGKPVISFEDFSKLDLRIATIVGAEVHPNADRLVKLRIDLGGQQRQICAGIRPYCADIGELVGKQVVVVANLAPRTIRGEVSEGMLLAASVMEGGQVKDVVILGPWRAVPPGSPVS